MARKKGIPLRDVDMDERPFGDSHFGAVRRAPRDAEKAQSLPRHAMWREAPSPDGSDAALVHSWHEGCFEDIAPKPGRSPRKVSKTGPAG